MNTLKKSLPVLFSTLTLIAHAQLPFTYETDAVLTSSGDFGIPDGRLDIIVVDRASGNVTIGKANSDNTMTWTPPEPSGITNVTGLAVAPFNGGTADAAALTSPLANRITLVSHPNPATQLQFRHLFPSSPSPRALAPFDPNADGTIDLLTVGELSSSPASHYYQLLTNIANTPSSLFQSTFPQPTYRIHRFIQKIGTTPVVAEHFGPTFFVETLTPTSLTTARSLPGVTLTPNTLMTYGYFDATPLAQVILYEPGSLTARAAKVTEPTPGTFSWATATTLTFPKALKQLVTIPIAAGGARLGVLFTDATAAIYTFDGTTLTLRSNLSGTPHEWLNPIGPDLLLTKANTGWQRFNTSLNNPLLNPNAAGANYPPPAAAARVSNIVFLDAQPFVDPTAAPVAQATVRAWTTTATGSGTSWNIAAADITSTGIGIPLTSSYNSSNSATHALLNQFLPNISLRNLEAAAGPTLPDLTITPATGTYPPDPTIPPSATFLLTFIPTLSNTTVKYRLNSGPWLTYNPNLPPKVNAATNTTATVQAYAVATFPTRNSPIRTATYQFADPAALAISPTIDADNDGLPDAWETAFNATDPNADPDGDSATNLDEYLNGTDPRDPLSTPPTPAGSFALTPTLVTIGGNLYLNLEWPSSVGPVILESTPTLSPASWTSITSGVTLDANTYLYQTQILPASSRKFFRLSRP